MCKMCDKIDFVLETIEMLCPDEDMRKLIRETGMDKIPGTPSIDSPDAPIGARLAIMTFVLGELAVKYNVDIDNLFQGVNVALMRADIRARFGESEMHRKLRELES